MSRLLILLLGLIALGVLAFFCIRPGASAIEVDLVDRVHRQLISRDIVWATVTTDGRELRLSGSAPSPALRDQAGEIAKQTWGVRSVDNQLIVSKAAPLPDPYELTIIYDGKDVTLKGYVVDEAARSAMINAASNATDGAVMDQLDIAAGAPVDWNTVVAGVMLVDLDRYQEVTSRLTKSTLSVAGRTSAVKLRDQLQQNITRKLPQHYSLAFDVTVAESVAAGLNCQKEFDQLLTGRQIHFETAGVAISARSRELLDKLVTTAGKCPDARIEIAGHTDDRGSYSMNLDLSRRRAKSIMDYLILHQVNADRLSAVGYGEKKPLADNTTAQGRGQNRRIEFNVLGE